MNTKNYTTRLACTAFLGICLLFGSQSLQAQDNKEEGKRHVKVVKIVNGEKTVVDEEIPEGVDVHEYLRSLGIEDVMPEGEGHQMVMIRKEEGDGEMEMNMDVRVISDGENEIEHKQEGEKGKEPRVITRTLVVKDGEVLRDETIEGGDHVFIMKGDDLDGDFEWIHQEGEGDKKCHKIIIHEEDEEVTLDGEGKEHKVIIRKHSGEGHDGNSFSYVIHTEFVTALIEDLSEEDSQVFKSLPAAGAEAPELEVTDLKIYPNPNDGKFTLEFQAPESREASQVRVIDANGKVVFDNALKGNSGFVSQQFDLTGFPKGMYFMTISQDGSQMVKKVIVQ